MIESIHIVGCGTVGSKLAFNLCVLRIAKVIHLYDDDLVSFVDEPEFPYTKESSGLSKVSALSNFLKCFSFSSDTLIIEHERKVEETLKSSGVVVDCRDNKTNFIEADLRASIDGNILNIDCRKDETKMEPFYEYFIEKDMVYINLAVSILTNFIHREKYKELDSLVIFDLKDFLTSGRII